VDALSYLNHQTTLFSQCAHELLQTLSKVRVRRVRRQTQQVLCGASNPLTLTKSTF
jgi:hypothetical protein